jgi:uncharacterized membrane protein HdeD (DUF308 family)
MAKSILFRNWWVLLIQGILMIGLSVVIFKNPNAVLSAVALWLGVIVLVTGLVGFISWFSIPNEERNISIMVGSCAMIIIGLLMITKMLITIKAITVLFGLLTAIVGWMVLSGSWNVRKQWSLWWIIALVGAITLLTGIKSIMDIYTGAESISNLIGFAVLLSGIGLIFFAFLKRNLVNKIKNRTQKD